MNRPASVLVLCTGNSARSILGEVLFNLLGEGRVRGFSAGSTPTGALNPGTVRLLERKGIDSSALRSKSWHEFAGPGAPAIDFAITVCANAAGEACPAFPGQALRAHWGIADPAGAGGDAGAVDAAFARSWALLEQRVTAFLALSFETMTTAALQESLDKIGQMEGAA